MSDCARPRNTIKSNTAPTLAALAERAAAADRRYLRQREDSFASYLEAGHALIEAKRLVEHGQWLSFLEQTGIPKRRAQRQMQLAAAGANASLVTFFGGIRATLERIEDVPAAQQKLAELDELRAKLDELDEREAILWEQVPASRRELVEKALENVATIQTLKSQLNEKVSELADETRTIKVLRRKAAALEAVLKAA